jgi:hypothetical protein
MDGRDPSYAYRPRLSSLLLSTATLLPVILLSLASVIFGFAGLIGIPLGLFLSGILVDEWYQRIKGTKRLEFRSSGLFVPGLGFWSRPEEIAYHSIRTISLVTGSYGNRIHIDYDGGHNALWAEKLPSDAAFQEVYKLLAAKIQGAPATGNA